MRLIDADKYCEFLNTYPLEKAQKNFMAFYREALQQTFECEVKAIPVEWIRKWHGITDIRDSDLRNYVMCTILYMLKDWKNENETNRCR